MNIFYLDIDPKLAAKYHCDIHCVKMITEYVQILSTNCRLQGHKVGHEITHPNHPSTIWARTSLSNAMYLVNLLQCLHDEWKLRYKHPVDKFHKSYRIFLDEVVDVLPELNYPETGLTAPAIAMKNRADLIVPDNPVLSYRRYYYHAKPFAKWRLGVPDWFKNPEVVEL